MTRNDQATHRAATMACFATTSPGLEQLAADELTALGAQVGEPTRGGVPFQAALGDVARVHVEARTIHRVVWRVAEFRARAFPELFKKASRVDWSAVVSPGQALALRASAQRSRLMHTRRLRETVADAIAKQVPSRVVALSDADATAQQINVRMEDDRCTLSVDLSGALLHQRGYRLETGRAPMRETHAAALLRWMRWAPDREPLWDVMCGSGTWPIEAAWMRQDRAPGLTRAFAFARWSDAHREALEAAQAAAQARSEQRALPSASHWPIVGQDRAPKAVEVAQRNAARAGVEAAITLRQGDLRQARAWPEADRPGVMVCNPPYGKRIGSAKPLRPVYRAIGQWLAEGLAGGWRGLVLSTRRDLFEVMCDAAGATPSDTLRFDHGGLLVYASCFEARPEGAANTPPTAPQGDERA